MSKSQIFDNCIAPGLLRRGYTLSNKQRVFLNEIIFSNNVKKTQIAKDANKSPAIVTKVLKGERFSKPIVLEILRYHNDFPKIVDHFVSIQA